MNNKKEIDFDNPPLVEVVLDVQFKEIPNFSSKDFASIFDLYKDDYPDYTEVPPLMESIDSFHGTPFNIKFELSNAPLRRQWYASSDKSQLIQFQPNRFVSNWKAQEGQPYIEYKNLKESYKSNFQKLQFHYLKNKGINIEPTQVEITYINHIKIEDGLNSDEMFSKVFNTFKPIKLEEGLTPDGMNWSDKYYYEDENIKGRLIVTTEEMIKMPEKQRVIALRLSFKGVFKKEGKPADDYIALFDKGNLLITKTFCGITTKEMHNIWR